MVVAAFLISVESIGPVFFKQERLGYNGKIFVLYKLRSMVDKVRVKHQQVYKNDSELTRIGKLIRRFKIDEFPQLINVFKGDMSFIGPRPCLPSLQEKFDENGKFRNLVRPGLSGLAQVNGNIFLSWPERWKYDREYVEKQSFLLDLKIFFKTFAIVLIGEDKFIKKRDLK